MLVASDLRDQVLLARPPAVLVSASTPNFSLLRRSSLSFASLSVMSPASSISFTRKAAVLIEQGIGRQFGNTFALGHSSHHLDNCIRHR
jgi:hypothetical protein